MATALSSRRADQEEVVGNCEQRGYVVVLPILGRHFMLAKADSYRDHLARPAVPEMFGRPNS